VCPTYQVLGSEPDSPRGRIYLMRAWAEYRTEATPVVREHLSRCLDCRACETACPSGVRYGEMIEWIRSAHEQERPAAGFLATMRRWVLARVFTQPARLRAAFRLAAAIEASGLRWLLRTLRWLPGPLRIVDELFPAIPPGHERQPLTGTFQPIGPRRARVALFTGCVMEQMFGRVNRATLEVLRRNGCEVVVPQTQVCCGALHVHNGQAEVARGLARQNLAAFPADVDAVIVNSAGCGAALKELGHIAPEATPLAAKVKDISEFLVELGLLTPPRPIQRKVAYDDPCHLCHAQGIRAQPRALLRSIPGLHLVPLRGAENCCGSAGIYNTVHTELSLQILADKIAAIRESGADLVASGNPGCVMQIGAGLRRAGHDVTVAHPIELLAAAYGANGVTPKPRRMAPSTQVDPRLDRSP
jgi:glycolate oxidase iron-sulfur subunit